MRPRPEVPAPNPPRRHRLPAGAVAALCAIAVAGLGGFATDIGPWYAGLRRPPWQPADFWFGPVWTLIFTLCAVSGTLAWRAIGGDAKRRRTLLLLWGANAIFNVLWSLLFFRLHRPDWALAEVGLLWLSIAALIAMSARASRAAAALLIPYQLWVTFAVALNWAVVQLNAPFVTG
ncbi:MAG: tryptophan-rich sensory protein [Burkholderiales bacterium]|nr:tryptophan-rich sensory protein [Burkholderiales bacterium]